MTVHRALVPDHATVIGDHCLLMVGVHVAHDCHLGNNVIMANNAMLAGHVHVDDRAYISGAAGVHQFCRVGTFAMVGGQAHLVQDVPPYVTVDGLSSLVVGLNKIGLRRAGYDQAAIQELMAAYRVIYRSGLRWAELLEQLRTRFPTGPAALFYEFLSTTARGIVSERRAPPGATIKLRDTVEAESGTGRAGEVRVAPVSSRQLTVLSCSRVRWGRHSAARCAASSPADKKVSPPY